MNGDPSGPDDASGEAHSTLEEYWDRYAPVSAEKTRDEIRDTEWLNRKLRAYYPNRSGLRIADIGAGTGFVSITYALMGNSVVATETSRRMLEEGQRIAEEMGAEVDFRYDDILHTELPAGSFDLVILRNVLFCIEEHDEALSRAVSLVKPGGFIEIVDGNYFLHLNDEGYRRRNDHSKLERGCSVYQRMLRVSEQDFDELGGLVGGFSINQRPKIGPETDLLMRLGMNNIILNCDDYDGYRTLTENGWESMPLKFTISAYKPYDCDDRRFESRKDSTVMMFNNLERSGDAIEEIFIALSAKERLDIIRFLMSGDRCVNEISDRLGVSKKLASYHLSVLRSSGLVCRMKVGRNVFYRLSDGVSTSFLFRIAQDVVDKKLTDEDIVFAKGPSSDII